MLPCPNPEGACGHCRKAFCGFGLTLFLLFWLGLPCLGWGQTLTVLANMNFGRVEFTNPVLNGNTTMGPNGAINYSPNSSGPGTGTAGQVRINGTTGLTVNVRCTNTMTLKRVGGNTIGLTNLRISIGTPQTFATATACRINLNNNVLTHVINANTANNIIYFGGRLATNGATVQNGSYNASNAGGGVQATLRVVYQ